MAESTGGVLIFPDDDAFLEFMGSLQEQRMRSDENSIQNNLFIIIHPFHHFTNIRFAGIIIVPPLSFQLS